MSLVDDCVIHVRSRAFDTPRHRPHGRGRTRQTTMTPVTSCPATHRPRSSRTRYSPRSPKVPDPAGQRVDSHILTWCDILVVPPPGLEPGTCPLRMGSSFH